MRRVTYETSFFAFCSLRCYRGLQVQLKCRSIFAMVMCLVLMLCRFGYCQTGFAEVLSSWSAEDLFGRMHEQSLIDCESAVAGYVVRLFNHVSDRRIEANKANLREAMQRANQILIANERALGREPDLEALEAKLESGLAEGYAAIPVSGYETFAVKYTKQGESYRIEQQRLPNDVPLEQLRLDLESGNIAFNPSYIRTWNGSQYAEINYSDSKQSSREVSDSVDTEAVQGFAAISYENRAKGVVKFTTLSRDTAADPNALRKLVDQAKMKADVLESKLSSGEPVMTLKVGATDSKLIYFEANVLPTRGYAVKSALMRANGAVMSREDYDGFVSTSAGFWLPTYVRKENFRLDSNHAPFLFSKEEMVAFESPKTNVPLQASIFDLSISDEFKSLPQLTHLLPQGSPYIDTHRPSDTSRKYFRAILFVITAIIIFGLVGIRVYRRRTLR